MQPLTSEWIAKTEGDFDSLQRELQVRVRPNYDSAWFHLCAAKSLKGSLQEQNIPFECDSRSSASACSRSLLQNRANNDTNCTQYVKECF